MLGLSLSIFWLSDLIVCENNSVNNLFFENCRNHILSRADPCPVILEDFILVNKNMGLFIGKMLNISSVDPEIILYNNTIFKSIMIVQK